MLIAFEGIDGAGKSTQARLLYRWLSKQGYCLLTQWNSSSYVAPATKQAKKRRELSPVMYSLFHAADLAHRHEREIRPTLEAGAPVIADRYVSTAIARDSARGCDPEWVRGIYSFAIAADITFYIRVSAEEALVRKDKRPNWYESGRDIYPELEAYESFCKYQREILLAYEDMSDAFCVLDGSESVKKIQRHIRRAVLARMAGHERPISLVSAS